MTSPQLQALCEQAVGFYQAGRLDEAERLCAQVRAADAGNFIACYVQGVIQFVRGQRGPALASMQAALAANPDAPQPLLYQGLLLDAEGRAEEALASFGKALTLEPGMVEALAHRGGVLQRLGRPAAALADFDLALSHRADFPPALSGRAMTLAAMQRPAEALTAFDRLLARDADNVEAQYNRGVLLLDLGRAGEALAGFDRALRLAPELAAAHVNRGEALKRLNRGAEALAAFDRALALNSGFAAAWNNRAVILRDMGRLDEALASADKAVALPTDADAWNNRGVVLRDLKRLEDALGDYDKAIALKPDDAAVWNNRGVVLRDLKRPEEALAGYDKAVALAPNYAFAWDNRAMVLRDLKRLDEALASAERALALQPGFANAWANKAAVLRDLQRLDEALACADKAVALAPDDAQAWSNRGAVLQAMNDLGRALASLDRAVALDPDHAEAWGNRGSVLLDLRRPDEAAASYEKLLALEPEAGFALGQYLLAKMHGCDWTGLDETLSRCVAAIHAGGNVISPFSLLGLVDDPALHGLASRIYTGTRCPGTDALGPIAPVPASGKIRIGYFSADFHGHATSQLLAELLEAHDPARFELYGFSFGDDVQDDMRKRIAAAFHEFLDVRGLSDLDAARLARARGLDIAVDLKGHTLHARPGIFAARAAPVQINYLGYPGTMGADYMDYIIGDAVVIPPGAEAEYREKIIRLPHSYQPNDSTRRISERGFTRQDAGLPESGFVFCCFNNNYKILPETFASWMRILQAADGSVLWLLEDSTVAADNLRRAAARAGVAETRLVFAPRLPPDEHLARHRLADLFLDTWPYNAHTTASDALWAGLPVLTFAGKAFPARVAASLLNAVGLPELITNSKEEYETLAIELALQPQKLESVRHRLAANRATQPLFDGRLIARHLETAYEEIAARRQSGRPPDHVTVRPEPQAQLNSAMKPKSM